MTDYMLDTNVCITIMKGHPGIKAKIVNIAPEKIGISSIVLAELSYGVCKSAQRKRNEQALYDFCSVCTVLDWPGQAAIAYGEIRASLETQGRIIGANDLLIAAHARHLNAVLVTNNVSEFKRVPGLSIENWI
ncbi:MAG: type II toxin-antitoxin system VapC family toxin [Desulfobacteraceae bacterium]|nr:type II toxin-antitoxin system VapC family toxin [Desulfobacteraceae bacterium]